jgi:hypothetical protein
VEKREKINRCVITSEAITRATSVVNGTALRVWKLVALSFVIIVLSSFLLALIY